jgi:hypothetical protein
MKQLPLFDDTAPITCTIEAGQRPGRKELLERMRTASLGVKRTDDGIVIAFSPDAAPLFEEFTTLEKQCCAFFGFDIETNQLRWEAPPSATEIMDSVHRFFSDSEISVEKLLV